MIVLKDPIYQTITWQGKAANKAVLDQAVQALYSSEHAWHAPNREHLLETWRSEILSEREMLTKILCSSLGLSQPDARYWLDGLSKPFLPLPKQGPVLILNELIDSDCFHLALSNLLAGNPVLLVCTAHLMPILTQLTKTLPSACPFQLHMLETLAQETWGNYPFAALYCYAQDASAREVHRTISGRYDLPCDFQVPHWKTLLLEPAANLKKNLVEAYRYNGQSFHAKRCSQVRTAGDLKLVLEEIKKLRIAAYDAQPAPDLVSQYSVCAAALFLDQMKHLPKSAVVHLAPKRLLQGTGMVTPGLISLAAQDLLKLPMISGPLLVLIER